MKQDGYNIVSETIRVKGSGRAIRKAAKKVKGRKIKRKKIRPATKNKVRRAMKRVGHASDDVAMKMKGTSFRGSQKEEE